MGETVTSQISELCHLALNHKDEKIRNAAGRMLGGVFNKILKTQIGKDSIQDPFAKVWAENKGFDDVRATIRRQGQRGPKSAPPHTAILRAFISDLQWTAAPFRIYRRLTEKLLGIAFTPRPYVAPVVGLGEPDKEELDAHNAYHGPVDANHLGRFEKWAKTHLQDLTTIQQEFAKAECRCKEPPSPKDPPCPRKVIFNRLLEELQTLPSKHFDSYWESIIAPWAKRIFAAKKSNPLWRDSKLQEDPRCPASFSWATHKDEMRDYLHRVLRELCKEPKVTLVAVEYPKI